MLGKNKYLEITDLLSNERQCHKFVPLLLESYIYKRLEINHDHEAICSGAFLTKATQKRLMLRRKSRKLIAPEFVVALFDSVVENRKLSQKNVMNLPK